MFNTDSWNAASRSATLVLAALFCGIFEKPTFAQPVARRVPLPNHVSARAIPRHDRGPLDPETKLGNLRLILQPSVEQAFELEALLERQRDPNSADYQNWLSPEEFGVRFGATDQDLLTLADWLRSEGFVVDETARAKNWIVFSGSARQVAHAFRTELRRYLVDGTGHFANASAPSIPYEFAGLIGAIRGMDDFPPTPMRTRQIKPNYTANSGTHYLSPDDLAAIYNIQALYKAGFDGTGQNLAIAGQTAISLSDIRAFRSQFGLPAKDPKVVLYGTNPGILPGDQIEAELDLEWSGAVARNANLIYVYSKNVLDSVQYAIDQKLAPVLSLSYGGCEQGVPATYRNMALQANAQGMTWMNASGDSGAAGCDYNATAAKHGPSVIFPANIPEITAVGGTEFAESAATNWATKNSSTWGSAAGYIPERAWNDTSPGGGIASSGGGASTVYAKPWWQTGPGVPNDKARDVPDISLTASGAHDGYIMYVAGTLQAVGGTSASSPAFAGIVSILNQYLVSKGGKPGLGNINPNLYAMAQTGNGAIHDITIGDNIVPCATGSTGCLSGSFGYKAGYGYDLVTGLGSVDAYNLVTKWTSLVGALGTTTAVAASSTIVDKAGSTKITAKVATVTGATVPTGIVNFFLGTGSLGVSPVALSAGVASAAITVNGTSFVAGNNTVTANYLPTGNFANSTGSVQVTLAVPVATTTVLSTATASVPAKATFQLVATVRQILGGALPTGNVLFNLGTTALGSAVLTGSGTAILTVSAANLSKGTNSITAAYLGSIGFRDSKSTPLLVTVSSPMQLPR